MKIAQVAPLFESVPPKGYGGTERVVSYLTEALVELGHEVTLFASGDSRTRAKLVSACPASLRSNAAGMDWIPPYLLLLEEVFRRADEFDIVHFHIDNLHYPLLRQHPLTSLTTLHGRLDLPELLPLYGEFAEVPVSSISDAQRLPLRGANWAGTVHHGLPGDLYEFYPTQGKYLAFLGRISPEKRPDRAIRIAREFGMPLKIAAKVDGADKAYFETVIQPLLKGPGVEFIGEIGDSQGAKNAFLGGAHAVLFPVDWPEPFGLVMVEAMACGTPVIAYRCGSVPEIIEHGKTGFIVDHHAEAIQACHQVSALSRSVCRATFERRFSSSRMARDYVRIYSNLIASKPLGRTSRPKGLTREIRQ